MTDQQIIETLGVKVMEWSKEQVEFLYPAWNPLENVNDAWKLLLKIAGKYGNAGVFYNDETKVWEFYAGADGHGYFLINVEGSTECEAICNGALKVVA